MKEKSMGYKISVAIMHLLISPIRYTWLYVRYINRFLSEIWRSDTEIHPVQFIAELIVLTILVLLMYVPLYFDYLYQSTKNIFNYGKDDDEPNNQDV